MIAWVVLALLGIQRVLEMRIARSHTRRLLDAGGRLVRDDGYGLIVTVHVLFFCAFAAELLASPWAGIRWWTWPLLAVFLFGQVLRVWTMRALGPRWTTRVVVLPGRPLVTGGPFRRVRHPNYLGVALELLALPLAFGLYATALLLLPLHLVALRRRIRREEGALAAAAPGPAAA